jgi:hypothetical protein
MAEHEATAATFDDDEEEDPEELVFGAWSSDEGEGEPAGGGDNFVSLPANGEGENNFLPAPQDELKAPDAEDLEEPVRPDYMDVFMPYVNLCHFDNLSYAFVNPPFENPDNLILQAADLGRGPDRVSLFPSSRGARMAVFATPADRDLAVSNGPFLGCEVSIFFERHDESDNHFLFQHDTMAALASKDYPLEHWQRCHIDIPQV